MEAKERGLVALVLASRRGQPLKAQERVASRRTYQSNSSLYTLLNSLLIAFKNSNVRSWNSRYDKKKGEGMAKPGVNRMAAVKQVV